MGRAYRILAFSDSHGSHKEMIHVANSLDYVDMIVHAGDYYTDLANIKSRVNHKAEYIAVKGNCDFGRGQTQAFFEINGVKILMVHGNDLGVKKSLNKIDYFARERGADIVIFGHTHLPCLKKAGEFYIINPGSIAEPRSMGRTYAIIEIDNNGKVNAEIKKFVI